ncbi:MAG: KTSC domain-containing protein [Bacteroidales bacterium]|nr:KTSC domain-containing protein [Bacteroidales bacterium]
MYRESVSSSNLAAVGYDANSKTLEIEFNHGGVYQYANVPSNVHSGLMNANSHGSYFHQYIKDVYSYTKL